MSSTFPHPNPERRTSDPSRSPFASENVPSDESLLKWVYIAGGVEYQKNQMTMDTSTICRRAVDSSLLFLLNLGMT